MLGDRDKYEITPPGSAYSSGRYRQIVMLMQSISIIEIFFKALEKNERRNWKGIWCKTYFESYAGIYVVESLKYCTKIMS